MKIKFQGPHKTEEVIDSLAAILRLFEEQYGVGDFNEIKLSLTLVNQLGEEVELIDANTSQVFDVLEVHKNDETIDGQALLEVGVAANPDEGGSVGTVH